MNSVILMAVKAATAVAFSVGTLPGYAGHVIAEPAQAASPTIDQGQYAISFSRDAGVALVTATIKLPDAYSLRQSGSGISMLSNSQSMGTIHDSRGQFNLVSHSPDAQPGFTIWKFTFLRSPGAGSMVADMRLEDKKKPYDWDKCGKSVRRDFSTGAIAACIATAEAGCIGGAAGGIGGLVAGAGECMTQD